MIVYLDTSAVVPVVIAEPSTELCRRIWSNADRRVTSQLTYVEVSAALAMAQRQGRISEDEHDAAWTNFTDIWSDVDVAEVTAELSESAARLAYSSALRGYDAVHCASAVQINDADVVAAAGDGRLLDAWKSLGLAVIDTNQATGGYR